MADTQDKKEVVVAENISTASRWAPAFRALILLCISIVATLVRVFSVI